MSDPDWMSIRIRIKRFSLNADPNPDPGSQFNVDLCNLDPDLGQACCYTKSLTAVIRIQRGRNPELRIRFLATNYYFFFKSLINTGIKDPELNPEPYPDS